VVPDQPIKQVEQDILKQPEEECIKVSESSDLSPPPGFENTKKAISNNSKCSTNFARHHKKDIKESVAKSSLWNCLAEFMNQHNGKFILFGDFNTVLHEYEMPGSLFSRIEAEHFNAFIDSTCLIDLPIGGRHFTKKADFGHSPFKLYNSWLSRDGFDDIVKSTWDSMETGNDFLESHIALDEVKNVVWECGSNKAPSPHGFSFAFIKKYWDLMKMDVFEFLIGAHYKIISKLLANWLSKVIDKVVSKEQSAFISGRQILDGPLIISEIIQWYKKRKKKMLIFKVDFEKAFDSVSWMYVDFILDSHGFGSKWRSWIRACLHSSRASILINGSPTSEFSIKRGLRQGDPLSHFLFILVMEGLHCTMYNAVNSGLIREIKLGSSGIVLSHLFYADDVIITTDWNPHYIDNIIRVLHVFTLLRGLK
nr:RNA-directed DNA polymerase, eukaryota, reverse transcriptase zinc-binding domain protein [Tanacetum cinerariifolium]